MPVVDKADDYKYAGRCVWCERLVTAKTFKEWHGKVKTPCPSCGRVKWRGSKQKQCWEHKPPTSWTRPSGRGTTSRYSVA